MQEIKIKIKGMSCGGCEKRVKNSFSLLSGVTDVEADYRTGEVKIKTNKDINKRVLEEKLDDLGFKLEKILN